MVLKLVVGHAARFDALAAVRASQERVHRRHVLLKGKRAPKSLFAHFALDVLIGVMGLHVKSEKRETHRSITIPCCIGRKLIGL